MMALASASAMSVHVHNFKIFFSGFCFLLENDAEISEENLNLVIPIRPSKLSLRYLSCFFFHLDFFKIQTLLYCLHLMSSILRYKRQFISSSPSLLIGAKHFFTTWKLVNKIWERNWKESWSCFKTNLIEKVFVCLKSQIKVMTPTLFQYLNEVHIRENLRETLTHVTHYFQLFVFVNFPIASSKTTSALMGFLRWHMLTIFRVETFSIIIFIVPLSHSTGVDHQIVVAIDDV